MTMWQKSLAAEAAALRRKAGEKEAELASIPGFFRGSRSANTLRTEIKGLRRRVAECDRLAVAQVVGV